MNGFWDFRGRRFVCIIGSRGTPSEALRLLEDTGECLCNRGIAVSSGDAEGADQAGVRGAMRSSWWPDIGARVYLPWNGIRRADGSRRWADNRIYFDASAFENYEQAKEIALKARGSFQGLKRGGIALHSRNPYQVLLDNLATPVASVVCWAEPVGKKGMVRGGTNTAVQIALHHNIPVINLATDEGMEKILSFLKRKGYQHD